MASREARIKATLNPSGVLSGLKQMSSATAASAVKMRASLSAAFEGAGKAGLKGMTGALSGLGSGLMSNIKLAATLGGAFELAHGIKQAIEMREAYEDLGFALEGAGQAGGTAMAQADVVNIAQRWAMGLKDVSSAYMSIVKETGNAAFSLKATESAARAALVTGDSMGTWATTMGILNEKFGITGDEIGHVTDQLVGMTMGKGGASLEEFGPRLAVIGAAAKSAGLSGTEGFGRVVALLNIADDQLGGMKKSIAGVSGLFDQLGDSSAMKTIEKQLGFKITHKKGDKDAISQIIEKSKGDPAKLGKAFGGDQLKLLKSLGDVYKQGGAKGLDEAMQKAQETALSEQRIREQEAEKLRGAGRKTQVALNTLTMAFSKPEMQHAIEQLAESLPKLAEGMAKLVKFAVDSPLLAGAALVGGKAAMGFAGGALGSAKDKIGKGIERRFFVDPDVKGSGKWAGAGKVLGAAAQVAMLAGLALALKEAIDSAMDDKSEGQRDAALGVAATGTGVGRGQKEAALEKARAQLDALKKEKGPGTVDATLSDLGELVGVVGGKGGPKTAGEMHGEKMQSLQATIATLEQQLAKPAKSADKSASSLDRHAAAADRATTNLEKLAKLKGFRGPLKPGEPESGADSPGGNQ